MNKQFEPFFEWAKANKAEAELDFIWDVLNQLEFNKSLIIGIWGYLLEFFDSVGIIISVEQRWDGKYQVIFTEGEPPMLRIFGIKDRSTAQQKAIKKAFEILEK